MNGDVVLAYATVAFTPPQREPWMADALCTETDPDAFFPAQGDSLAPARRVCAACDVSVQCLEYALRLNIVEGVFGGLSSDQRRRLRVTARGVA